MAIIFLASLSLSGFQAEIAKVLAGEFGKGDIGFNLAMSGGFATKTARVFGV
ncbi:hypothetical protein KEF85_02790 [Methylomonas paludis]|uniref:Uncharacterized protein n=1 Tax=Methylomonas paludis TaxID=1173101 RepID=A0A975MPJ2_9GAMM|nr:hypothetical protein [Methylomonas paludis]QWF71430.1 hypothetical protein KEF85_02790 [Methylomonas paludis]